MRKLPVEIFEQIFKLLHQVDKVECMLVCRSWQHVIENTVLFNTICLISKVHLDKLVDKARLEPENGGRVEQLIFEAQCLGMPEINILPSLFPNIRKITFHQEILEEDPGCREAQPFQPWKEAIKVVRNEYSHFPAYQILKGATCPQLTEIQVGSVDKDSSRELIKLLGNAPNLKILKLRKYEFTLTDLEALHKNVPLLESLSIVIGDIDALLLPNDIKPAIYMKKLKLRNLSATTTENAIDLEKYLAKKYPRIFHFCFDISMERECNLEALMNKGFALQIQQIGSHLTSLKFVNKDNLISLMFPILDRNECKIKRVNILGVLEDSDFDQITRSNQAQHIQALSCWLGSCSTITRNFNNLTVLTELKLHFDNSQINVNLSYLMGEIGCNLETLELSYGDISLDLSLVPTCPRLKKLRIQIVSLPPGADVFISHAFPNLRKLIMEGYTWESPKFCIDNLSLSYLEIRTRLFMKNNHILIITTSNNEKRWYTAESTTYLNPNPPSDPITCPAIKSLPFDKYNGTPFQTLVCKSLSNFLLVDI